MEQLNLDFAPMVLALLSWVTDSSLEQTDSRHHYATVMDPPTSFGIKKRGAVSFSKTPVICVDISLCSKLCRNCLQIWHIFLFCRSCKQIFKLWPLGESKNLRKIMRIKSCGRLGSEKSQNALRLSHYICRLQHVEREKGEKQRKCRMKVVQVQLSS